MFNICISLYLYMELQFENLMTANILMFMITEKHRTIPSSSCSSPLLAFCWLRTPPLSNPKTFLRLSSRQENCPSTTYALSYPFSSNLPPNTGPIPASSVTFFSPIGSLTKLRCFCEVELIILRKIKTLYMCQFP